MNFLKKYFTKAKLHPLARNNYTGRMVYTGVLSLIGIPILIQNGNSFSYIIAIISTSILWPQISLLMLWQSKDQRWFEQYININLDACIIGAWGPILQFNPLAIIIYVSIIGSGGVLNGGFKFMFIRIASGAGAIAISTMIYGFKYNPETSFITIISFGLAFIISSIATAFISYNAHMQLSRAKKTLKHQKQQMEVLSSKLSKYLSPQIFNSIFTGKRDVRIETSRKKLTIFFSDIQNFTSTTEFMEAEDLSSLLNNYLNEMTNIAIKYGGTIDKYIGDAIMIFFGDPESKGEQTDALSCVSMAIEMRNRMVTLREQWHDMGIVNPLHIRIGINTGFCTVGNFGSDERLDYTVIGGQVNLASRLESSAEPNQILISEDTFLLIKNEIACRKIGEISVKGISKPVMTYQVIDFNKEDNAPEDIMLEERKGLSVKIDFSEIKQDEAASLLKDIIARLYRR